MQRGVLQQHDGLGIDDLAVGDHRKRRVDRPFEQAEGLVREIATGLTAPCPD
jgi:hypothetical protein